MENVEEMRALFESIRTDLKMLEVQIAAVADSCNDWINAINRLL